MMPKLVDMPMYPSEEEIMSDIRKDAQQKEAKEASKTYNSILLKFEKEKEKYIKLSNDLKEMITRLFNGIYSAVDDKVLKLMKDLKLHVAMKSIPGDDAIPAIIVKLPERIELIRDRPFNNLLTYLKFKGCARDDVLAALVTLAPSVAV